VVEAEEDDLAAAADAPRFGAFRVCNFSSVLVVVAVVVVAVGVGGLVTTSPSTATAYDNTATATATAADEDDDDFYVELDPDGVVVTPALI
jgi:hypothetical protein